MTFWEKGRQLQGIPIISFLQLFSFPSMISPWIEEVCKGPTVSLSSEEHRLLSVGYGDRNIHRSLLHDGTIHKGFSLGLSLDHLPAASSPGT